MPFRIGLIFMILVMCVLNANPTAAVETKDSQTGFLSAFEFTEVTEKGEIIPVKEGSIAPVDINSVVRIKIHPENFSVATETGFSGLTENDLSKQRESMLEILEALKEYSALALEFKKVYAETHDASGKELSGKEDALKQLKELRQKRNAAANFIIRTVRNYVALTKFADNPAVTQHEITQWLVDHKAAKITDEKFAEFIKGEIKMMEEEMRRRKDDILSSLRTAKLRLTARLYPKNESPIYLHLPGYDKLESGEPNFVDRMSFILDDKSKEELKKEVAFSAQFAAAYNEARKEGSDLISSYSKKITDLKNLQRTFISSLTRNTGKLTFNAVIDFLNQLEKNSKYAGQKQEIAALRADFLLLEKNIETLMDNIKQLSNFTIMPEMTPEQILVDLPQTKLKELEKNFDTITKLFDKNETNSFPYIINSIETRLQKEKEIAAEVAKEFGNFVGENLTNINDTEKKIEGTVAQLKELFNQIDDLFGPANVAIITQDPPSIIEIPMNDVQDTEIQITRAARHENDMMEFKAKLLTNNGTDLKGEGSKIFKILEFGLHSKISGNVIFVDRVSGSSNFVAAPAVSYMVHYRSRENNKCGTTWNVIDPAMGLSTALLNFQEGGVEIGVGLALSFFGDILQVGYGYNLQVTERHDYLFVGIGLYEMFDAIRGRQSRF